MLTLSLFLSGTRLEFGKEDKDGIEEEEVSLPLLPDTGKTLTVSLDI